MSWIICRKDNGQAVLEVWNKSTLDHLNTAKYIAVPAMQYLCNLNKQVKGK